MAEFTEKQVGKEVVAQSGATVGTVDYVRNGELHVAVAGDVDEDLLTNLRWDGVVGQDVQHLPNEFVSTVTDDAIRLRV